VVTKRTETTVAALFARRQDRSVAARRDCVGEAIARAVVPPIQMPLTIREPSR
jgi:hypothetical protein